MSHLIQMYEYELGSFEESFRKVGCDTVKDKSSFESLGCTIKEYRHYIGRFLFKSQEKSAKIEPNSQLESKFEDGMTW